MMARLIAVRHGTGALTVQVLIQRAAERDVEDLDAAADCENGQPALGRGLDECDLRGVAISVDFP